MARKIPIKVTGRVTTRVQTQVRVQQHTRRTGFAAAWQGPMPLQTTNYYGDTNTVIDSTQVAIGVQGSVTQISGPPPVDVDALARIAEQVLQHLDELGAGDDDRERLRADAEDILDAADTDEPDEDRLRSRGRSVAGVLGRVGTAAAGGTLAHIFGPAIAAALGG